MLESIGGKGLVSFCYRLVVRWLFLVCKVPDRIRNAAMAQLVAQLICNQWVAGSIPVGGTIKTPGQTLKTSGLTFLHFLDNKDNGDVACCPIP